MNLTIFSKAMFSSWCLYRPARVLFDVGDGCSTTLDKDAFAIERVLISHGHSDHVSNLPSLIGNRGSMKGATNKPLTIYHPESRNMTAYKELIGKLYTRLPYDLQFVTIEPGFKLDINEKTFVEAFEVKHCYGSMGYKVMERRSRLKAGVKPEDARALKAQGIDIHEDYDANVFTWLLDSATYDLKHIGNAAHCIMDGTFMTAAHRDDETHASVEECLERAVAAKVKRVSLAHISCRYTWAEAKTFIHDAVTRSGFTGKVDIILSDKVYEI